MEANGSIGFFDSGFGGLTVLKSVVSVLPRFDFVYLGDNARAPYGNKSFDLIHEYTLEGIEFLFNQGCELVILACNTASAKALRTIQQNELPLLAPEKRVLGVIRPSAEEIGNYSKSGFVGILGTEGTIKSASYVLELNKTSPQIQVIQHACPLWVPLIEEEAYHTEAGRLIIAKDIEALFNKNSQIDTIVLACTHYPIIQPIIEELVPTGVQVLNQGPLVAHKLEDYLFRHPELTKRLSKQPKTRFFTTESASYFNKHASKIFGQVVKAKHIQLTS